MGSLLRVGEVFRSARNRDPEVELIDGYPNIHHVTASEKLAQIQLSKGINPTAKVRTPSGPRRPCILIRSSPWKAGTAETPWHDVFDLENGRIRYFGDHRVDHTVPVGTTPGNAVLLEASAEHQGRTAEQRALAVPLLVFAAVSRNKTPKGYVKFCGVAVMDHAEQIEQQVKGRTFPNYRYELSILDLSAEDNRVDWAWIEARGNPELTAADTLGLAPLAWRRWVEQGHVAMPRVRRVAIPAPERGEPTSPKPESGQNLPPSLPAPRTASDSDSTPCTPPESSAELMVGQLMDRLRNLRVHKRNGLPSRHKPLALLWGISRVATGKPHLATWREFRDEVGVLLAEFGLPDSSVTPEYPFLHLQTSQLWDVHGLPPEQTAVAHAAAFDRLNPEAGVSAQTATLLADPFVRSQAMAVLRETYLADVDQHALMERLGLTGYETAGGIEPSTQDHTRGSGPAARRTATSSRIIRDTALTAKVKKLHGDRCQVCDLQLATRYGTYSEAAHIRGLGHPHDGPDELPNLLVLCPNHHVQFDTLAIYIDPEGYVRSTADDRSIGRLRRHPAHPLDEAHLRYHRALCGRNTTAHAARDVIA
ncbi:HNH endonuclease [Streptomyces hydrogenans]|uniref:HNH endonuclease n=1 Tax=Streptomyces hydrogenans TaxID=1873719 RepID=UPI00382FC16D